MQQRTARALPTPRRRKPAPPVLPAFAARLNSSISLPRLSAKVRKGFSIQSASNSLPWFADTLATEGILTPDHWQRADRNPSASCRIALHDWVRDLRPKGLANLCLSYHDTAARELWLEASDGDHNHGNDGAFFVVMDGKLFIGEVGKTLSAIEENAPRHGAALMWLIHRGLTLTTGSLDPRSGFYWCQDQYWMGEVDESLALEELCDHNGLREREADEQTGEVPPHNQPQTKQERDLNRAEAAEHFEIFRRADYDQHIPTWAGSEMETHTLPVSQFVERCPIPKASLATVFTWPEIVAAAARVESEIKAVEKLKRTYEPHLYDDPKCYSMDYHICPFLLRWHNDDPLTRIYDDVMNDLFNAGEASLDKVSVFFFNKDTLADALHRLKLYLQLLQSTETLLNLIVTNSQNSPIF